MISPLARRSLAALELPPPFAAYRPGWTERMYTNPYGGEHHLYPCPRPEALRARYAGWLADDLRRRGQEGGFDPERILFTAGSIAGIDLLIRAFCEPGSDRVGIQSPAFPLYAHYARACGIEVADVPIGGADRSRLDVDRIVAAGAKLTFVCRPNNPVGSAPPWDDLVALADRIGGLLVVDEAYVEFCDLRSAAALVDRPNVAVLRTFSKAWGLAGARAGAILADPGVLHAVRLLADPFAFDGPAQRAVAEALSDPDAALAGAARIRAQREALSARLRALPGVDVIPSEANFVLVTLDHRGSAPSTALRIAPSPIRGALRIAIGTPDEDSAAAAWVEAQVQPPARTDPGPELPAAEILRRRLTAPFVSQALHVFAKLDLAELLSDGPRTAAEIAGSAALHAPPLYRMLRALCDVGVLVDRGPDGFALAPIGRRLCSSAPDSIRTAVIHHGEEPFRVCGGLLDAVRSGDPTFDRMYGLPFYRYLDRSAPAAETFHRAMTELTRGVADRVVASCPIAEGERVVDVGGGEGLLLATLLAAHPTTSGLLFEAPSALIRAEELLGPYRDRCRSIAGDFFEAVPEGGSAYLLKSVLSDWDGPRALALLRNVRRALADGGRLWVVERVLADRGPTLEGCVDDLLGMAVRGGAERTLPEYASLLSDGGFRLAEVVPTGSAFQLLHAVPA